jgi:hypothetical protein
MCNTVMLFIHIFFLYCGGWGYIVAFAQILKVYQIYHTWIHLLNHSPSSLHPWFLEKFQQVSFFAFTYMCTHFIAPSSPSHFLSPHLLPTVTSPPLLGRTYSALLFSNFVREKRETIKWKTWHCSLR